MTPPIAPPGPSRAERARIVLGHAQTAVLEVDRDLSVVIDVLAPDADGSLVLLVDAHGPLIDRVAHGPAACVLHARVVSPVPGPDRVLDTLTVHGTVELAPDIRAALEVVLSAHPHRPAEFVLRPDASALLQIRVERLGLDGEPVDLDAYARAERDPVVAGSDEVVTHLLREHPQQVVQLLHLLPAHLLEDAWAVAPVRIDRFGITLRLDTPDGPRRARLDFPAALRGPAELPAAMQRLQRRAAQVTACPFGTRSRPTDRDR